MLLGDDIISRIEKINIIGREINVFNQTTSTNNVVEKMAVDGVAEGVVVFAESQTKGRGIDLVVCGILRQAKDYMVFHSAADPTLQQQCN